MLDFREACEVEELENVVLELEEKTYKVLEEVIPEKDKKITQRKKKTVMTE